MSKFDINDFIVDKVVNIKLCWRCPSCKEEYELIKNEYGVWTNPHFCPHCNYDLYKHRRELVDYKNIFSRGENT